MVSFGLIDEWEPGPGRLVSWVASPDSVARARRAPVHPAPPSHQQEQYLRLADRHAEADFRYSGLCLVTAEIPTGDLDLDAMTRAVNAFLRRHDTFRTWFRIDAAGAIERHLVPEEDVEFVPIEYGRIDDADTLRDHVQKTTPGPFDWDCFTFGTIQREESTTVYAAVDHLHTDGFGQYLTGFDLALLYLHEVWEDTGMLTPAASYLDYCATERGYTGRMTLSSPGVRKWLELIRGNDGELPSFPLDLGRRTDVYNRSAHRTVTLFDEATAQRFERVCRDNGAEFVGGVFAAAALAERDLVGGDYYFGMTPVSTRSSPEERASVGWYATLLPVAFPLGPTATFARVVKLAHRAYENGMRLAATSFQRVVELLPADSDLNLRPGWATPMISFVDARELLGNDLFDVASCGLYANRAASEQVLIWINRLADRTMLSVIYPDTPVAHGSVERYVDTLKAVFVAAVEETQ
ncbi:condensation domain-containing protein [Nocardia sp. NPDC003482]|uniref:condensation domain-containing protein n=1 Tax=Nocardia sp. NPDC004068 TaxID=3364303 RepID=UPI003697C278